MAAPRDLGDHAVSDQPGSGEHFIVIRGNYFHSGFLVHVRFSGPAGTFTLYPNASSNSTLTCWVPLDVVNTAGFYDVVVHNDSDHGEPVQESLPFEIEVRGTPAPRLHVPPDFSREATGPDGAIVTYEVSATSAGGKALTPDCAPLSGSRFKLGTTTVQCSVNDPDGSRQTAGFKVSVRDTTAPFMTVPDDMTIPATSADGAVVHFDDATATDIVDGTIHGYCTPAPGALFPIGTTQVHCWAFDTSSNSAYGTFKVIVTTAPPPVLHLPRDISVEATSAAGARVTYDATADNGEITCAPPSGSTFPLGTTTVACTAGSASGTFHVNVIDSVRPVIRRISATPDLPTPVNHKFVSVHVSVTASDSVDDSPVSRIIDVEANEPVQSSDWRITGALRAERNGQEHDRVYTIVIETRDDSGNTATGRVTVTVPHDQSGDGSATVVPPTKRRAVRR